MDHGKSTLIGRIFHDTNSLPDGKVEQIQKACAAEGMEFEYAFLLDALLEEQEQNITIDTTQIQFRTAKRHYVIIDAPGHKEFLKNMITGAASADAAVLLIAANEGVREQTRRHGYLLEPAGHQAGGRGGEQDGPGGFQRGEIRGGGGGVPGVPEADRPRGADLRARSRARNGFNVGRSARRRSCRGTTGRRSRRCSTVSSRRRS